MNSRHRLFAVSIIMIVIGGLLDNFILFGVGIISLLAAACEEVFK